MFGKIGKIENGIIYVENLSKVTLSNMIGIHVVFEETKKTVGEILAVNEEYFNIRLIGEIVGANLITGIMKFPTSDAKTRMVYKNELEMIIGFQENETPKNLLLGSSNIYSGYNVTVNNNDFFSNHFAIIGNTGSGKSCGVSRIFQNLFSEVKKNPTNSHFIIFDTYGEYKTAFSKINTHPGINVKNYSSNVSENDQIIQIPPYFLEVDDLAILLNLTDSELIPVLEKTLRYVYIFKGEDSISLKYKNDIIAKVFLDILASGKTPQQTRDQSIAFLSKYFTNDINLETVMVQPGYNRTIRQCLNIDSQGKILAMELLIEYLKKYSEINVEKIAITSTEYSLDDLYDALDFALVSEGSLSNSVIFEKLNKLKTRLHSIINGEYKKYFEYNGYISVENYIKKMFTTDTGENVQIINMDFNYLDDRIAKVIVKIYSKLFYKYVANLESRGSFPINIIIEEAHRYIQRDNDVDIIGYNIFDRISKEGRKYGILLGIITQRLSELSATALSQCSNFVIFRMYHPEDIKIVASIASNVTMDAIEKVKSLRPGMAMLFGSAFKIPLIAQFEIPDPMPTSTNIDLTRNWYSD